MKKRFFSVFLISVFLLSFFSVGIFAATPRTTVLDTSEMGTVANAAEGWAWDKSTNTLTLSGIDFQIPSTEKKAIILSENTTVFLAEGTVNNISFTSLENDYRNCVGISYLKNSDSETTAVLKGKGTLKIANAAEGIYSKNTNFSMEDSTLVISNCVNYGIHTKNFICKNGNLTISDSKNGIFCNYEYSADITDSTVKMDHIDVLTLVEIASFNMSKSTLSVDHATDFSSPSVTFKQCNVSLTNMITGFLCKKLSFIDSEFYIEAVGTENNANNGDLELIGVGIGTFGATTPLLTIISSKGTVKGSNAAIYSEFGSDDAFGSSIQTNTDKIINLWGNKILKGGEIVEKNDYKGLTSGQILCTIGTANGTYGYHKRGETDETSFGFPEGDYSKEVVFGLPFDDVAYADWFYRAVAESYGYQLFNGTTETTFSPNVPMSRGMVVAVLYRMAKSPTTEGLTTPFTDVASDQYYGNAVAWAYKNGIVKGITPTSFEPDTNITREQFATYLFRYATYKNADMTPRDDLAGFSDKNNVSPWAVDAMSWCVNKGYISGVTTTTLEPQGYALRNQAATILVRFLDDLSSPTTATEL